LEYWSQLKYVDNLAGAVPMILISGITGLLIALIWKRYKNLATSTIVFWVLLAIWGLLLIPAITGNWYPLAKILDYGSASPDMTIYAPFTDDTQAAKLPRKASITITGELPRLDGATALYPLYAALANAVYNEADYSHWPGGIRVPGGEVQSD
jgi:phosphate transport system substrate-binding protein